MERYIIFPDGTNIKIYYLDKNNINSGYIRPNEMPDEFIKKIDNNFLEACYLLEDGTHGIHERDIKIFLSNIKYKWRYQMDKDNMTAQQVSEYEIKKSVDEFFEAQEMGMELDEYRKYVKKKEQEQKKIRLLLVE